MTSKSWFFNGMTEEIKRRLWAAALSVLVFFFSLPVVMVYLTTVEYSGGDWTRQFGADAIKYLSYDNGWLVFLMAVLAALLGISGFAYLHSRRKVDFYHSLPIRREKLFAVQYVTGALIAAVPYLFFAVVSAAVAAVNGAPAGEVFSTALEGWAFLMLSFMILYTTAVIAVMMTGNTVVSVLGFLVFCACIPLFLGLWQSLAEICLDTFCDTNMMADWVPRTSPFAFYISGLNGDLSAGKIISRLAVWGILLLIALFLHKKRPSEAAGKAMAFSASQPVIRILLVTECSVAGLLFFWTLGNGLGWAVFGLLAGGVISHCVIEIIYHFDFKKLFSHRLQMGLSMALAFGFFALFYWDLTGYDAWIPDEGRLESAAVYAGNVDSWVDVGSFEEPGRKGAWSWTETREVILGRMELEDKNLARKLAESWQELSKSGEEELWQQVYVEYRLTDGRKVLRQYRFSDKALQEVFGDVYEDDGYKKGRYPLLDLNGEELREVQLSVRSNEILLGRQKAVPQEDLVRLLEAYQQDLMDLTLEDSEETPLAEIRFLDEQRLKAVENGDYRYEDAEFYPVYPACQRTRALLQELGLYLEEKTDPDTIRSIQVEAYVPVNRDSGEESGDVVLEESWDSQYYLYEETDREMIRRIAEEMIYRPYEGYRNLYEGGENVYLSVNFTADSAEEANARGDGDYTMTDREIYYTMQYYIPEGKLADELTRRAIELSES